MSVKSKWKQILLAKQPKYENAFGVKKRSTCSASIMYAMAEVTYCTMTARTND